MKKAFIKDIRERDQVADTFLAAKKDMGISRTGKPYLIVRIMDSSGEMEVRVWEDAEAIGRKFEKDDLVLVKGFAVAYQGGIQVNATDVEALPSEGVSMRDYLPSSTRPPSEMMAELDGVIAGMKDAHLKRLLTEIFSDKDVRGRFMTAPAAKSMHHPYLGGLLEHVLSMCALAKLVSGHYGKGIDRDLLLTGAILHDIGKIYELSYRRSFDYTDEGKLLGHITMGVGLIEKKAASIPDFPVERAVLLKHMILSHHGHLEFGSPKRPKTLEAFILYYLDDLDAKVNAVGALIENNIEGADWTPYQRLFERAVYRGGRPDSTEAGEAGEGGGGGGGREGGGEGGKGVEKKTNAKEGPELDLFKKRF